MQSVIRASGLAKSYGGRPALLGLDLDVPAGIVFGYLGPNGAGKTTTIRLIAGLLRPTSGRVEVLGMDAVRDRERVQRRLGYLPGEFRPYPNQTGRAYLEYLANLRGGVPAAGVHALAERLGLDLSTRVGAMSHGNRQKLGVVQAFFHSPDLVLLDEPTAGLDPLVQREFLDLVRDARDQGRTVFLSSHNLDEVEAVADTVGIIRQGRLVVVDSVGSLKSKARRRLELTFSGPPPMPSLRAVPGVREATGDGFTARLVIEGSTAALFREAAPYGIASVVTHEPDLEEIFMSYYDRAG